jgi:hypothetical protein
MSVLTRNNIVTNGLVLYLDAASKQSYTSGSTVWRDLSGNDNSGTLTNGPTFNAENGGSIVFDGVDDYVDGIGTTSTFSFIQNTGVFTISVWVRLIDLSVPRYFLGNNNGSASFKGFYLGYSGVSGRLWLAITYGVGGQVTVNYLQGNFLTINDWIQVACVGDGTTLQVYKNGIRFGSPASFGVFSTGDSTRTLSVGRINIFNSSYWSGNVSNTLIYNRALSQNEISQNFNATKGRFNL